MAHSKVRLTRCGLASTAGQVADSDQVVGVRKVPGAAKCCAGNSAHFSKEVAAWPQPPRNHGVAGRQGDGHKHKKNALSDGQGRLAWILLAPTLIIITVVAGIPVILSFWESLHQTNAGVDPTTGMIAGGDKFVGLQNFTDIFTGANPVTGSYGTMDRFWNAFLNTTFITIVCVLLETVIGVAMALIMAKAFRGRGIVRAGILVPWAIPTIVSALMWKLIFDSSGVMNRISVKRDSLARRYRGLVLGDRHRDTWKTAPFIGLLTLAGLQTIPAEVL